MNKSFNLATGKRLIRIYREKDCYLNEVLTLEKVNKIVNRLSINLIKVKEIAIMETMTVALAVLVAMAAFVSNVTLMR